MSILNEDVNVMGISMKGAKKMSNTISVDWKTIYNGQEETAGEIIADLYNEKNYKELHIALWTWLSLDDTKDKWEWFERFDVPAVKNYCFACREAEISFRCNPPIEYALEGKNDIKSFCDCCPLTNPSSEECLNGLYDEWLETYLVGREDLAMEIANMKWTTK